MVVGINRTQDGSLCLMQGSEVLACIGARSTPPLVGYECDGAPLEWSGRACGRATVATEAEACGTPAGFVPLAVGALNAGWQELPQREHHAAGAGLHSATMGIFAGEGQVFSAGTTDWAQVLDKGSEPAVPLITRNVIERLSRAAR